MDRSSDPRPTASLLTPVDTEKRDAERVTILGDLRAEIMVFQPMLISEISRTGLTVECGFPLQIDSLHEIRLTLGERSVVVKARVAHSRISDVDQVNVVYRTGLEFVQPSAPVAGAIAAFLDSLKTGRSGA
jgi:hypothetical protein